MKLSSQIRSIGYLKAHAAEIVRTLGDRREPLIITRNGEAKVVIQDIDSYEETQETVAAKESRPRKPSSRSGPGATRRRCGGTAAAA